MNIKDLMKKMIETNHAIRTCNRIINSKWFNQFRGYSSHLPVAYSTNKGCSFQYVEMTNSLIIFIAQVSKRLPMSCFRCLFMGHTFTLVMAYFYQVMFVVA